MNIENFIKITSTKCHQKEVLDGTNVSLRLVHLPFGSEVGSNLSNGLI